MPQFAIPQFIEKESKILGPLTFKQIIYIGISLVICVVLYFSLAKINFFLFILLAIPIFGLGVALALVKVGGVELSLILAGFLKFLFQPKVYLWGKRSVPVTFLIGGKEQKILKEKSSLETGKKGLLQEIKSQLEIKKK